MERYCDGDNFPRKPSFEAAGIGNGKGWGRLHAVAAFEAAAR